MNHLSEEKPPKVKQDALLRLINPLMKRRKDSPFLHPYQRHLVRITHLIAQRKRLSTLTVSSSS